MACFAKQIMTLKRNSWVFWN